MRATPEQGRKRPTPLRYALDTVTEPSSPAWHDQRATGIGGSDARALVGLDERRDAYTVWAEKLGLLADTPDSEAMRWGRLLEPIVADEWALRAGVELSAGAVAIYDPDHPHRRGNPDRLVYQGGALDAGLEVKVTTRGDDWTAGPPSSAVAQVWHYQLVSGFDRYHVAGLVGERGGLHLVSATFEADPAVLGQLASVEDRFWETHVLPAREAYQASGDWWDAARYAPAPSAKSRATVNALMGAPRDETVDLDVDLAPVAAQLVDARARMKAAEADKDAAEARLHVALAGAKRGLVDGWRVTYVWTPPRHEDARLVEARDRPGSGWVRVDPPKADR